MQCREGLSPIIDVATLTGGIVVALGSTMTGMFCNDEDLSDEIIAAGQAVGENSGPCRLMPSMPNRSRATLPISNRPADAGASAVTAAKILENFVGDAEWAHLDIAGTSYVDSKKPYQEKGSTGFAVRTLAELALRNWRI